MDPMRMSPHDVYSVLALLSKTQDSGVRLLEFSIGDIFDSHAEAEQETSRPSEPPCGPTGDEDKDNATAEITELSDLTIQPPSPARCTVDSEHTASPRNSAIDGIGPPSLDSLPPLLLAPATSVVSPIIDRPSPSTPPLSESMIKVAIENVAKAGYLNIPEASTVDPLHQVLKTAPQQDGKAKTKKRKREEIEIRPNEDKQRKKQPVPTREQSSRYDIRHFLRAVLTFVDSRTPTIRTSTSPSAPVRSINGLIMAEM